MAILTPTQKFQNIVNSTILQLPNFISDDKSQSIASAYARYHTILFAYPDKTPAEVMTQLGTNAAATVASLKILRDALVGAGVVDVAMIPAHAANTDGTVTLS